MWLFTKFGFFSIVDKPRDPIAPGYHVRSRSREDLENLAEAGLSPRWADGIVELEAADYRYRIVMGEEEVDRLFALLGSSIDYSNFKNKIRETPGQAQKLSLLHRIWEMVLIDQNKADRIEASRDELEEIYDPFDAFDPNDQDPDLPIYEPQESTWLTPEEDPRI